LVADPDQVEVLIDWGYSAVTLVACYQQELLFCRKLECPALLGIVSQLQQSFQLSTAAAARFLERMSLSPANTPNSERRADDKCVRILNEHASLLNREIRIALKYLAWRMPTVPCQRLWITGGGACASALMELLNQQSPLPCRAWSWQPAAHLPALPADMAIAAALAQGE
jgi:Tfp pilus assembly PilM family ATPase